LTYQISVQFLVKNEYSNFSKYFYHPVKTGKKRGRAEDSLFNTNYSYVEVGVTPIPGFHHLPSFLLKVLNAKQGGSKYRVLRIRHLQKIEVRI